jgi:hypothetical protein
MFSTDPQTNESVALFNPRRQIWREHFRWDSEGVRIEGTTPRGRATVVALKLNRPLAVAVRKQWVLLDKHPPSDEG